MGQVLKKTPLLLLVLIILLAGCGSSAEKSKSSQTETGISDSVKIRLKTAASYGVSDRELIALFHPEIIPYTVSSERPDGTVLPTDEFSQKMIEELDYYRELLTTVHPAPANGPLYDVESVIDGTTIKVSISGKLEIVKLIGLTAPKKCGAQEAIEKLKEVIGSEKIALEVDPTVGDRDASGSLLRYVWKEKSDVGLGLLGNGFVYEEGTSYKYQDLYTRVREIERKAANEGVWDSKGCKGQG